MKITEKELQFYSIEAYQSLHYTHTDPLYILSFELQSNQRIIKSNSPVREKYIYRIVFVLYIAEKRFLLYCIQHTYLVHRHASPASNYSDLFNRIFYQLVEKCVFNTIKQNSFLYDVENSSHKNSTKYVFFPTD